MGSRQDIPQAGADRRHFHRIASDKPALVRSWDGEHEGSVRDISLRGMLIDIGDSWQPVGGERVYVHVRCDDEPWFIEMYGEVAHVVHSRIGVRCIGIDLESATKLRRLIELNLADQEMLERDIEQMIAL